MKRDADIEEQKQIIENVENALNALVLFSQKDRIITHDKHPDFFFAIAIDALERKYNVECVTLKALEALKSDH